MATIALKSSAYEGRYFEFTVTQQSGTTKVNWTFKVLGGSSPYYDTSEINCKINGKSVLTYSQTSWDKKVIPAAKGSVTGVYNVGKYGAVAIELSGNPYDHQVKSVKKSTLTLIGTYTITYNANGGSGAPSNQTKTYGVALTLSKKEPTRTGYTFVKWNTKSDGSGTSYAPGGSYKANAGVTLYAIWKVNTYTVTFNANGGSGVPASSTKTYNVALPLPTPKKTGYSFKGWKDSAGTLYNSTYTANASVTLYAQWEIATYTITYNANGGSGAPSNQTKTYGVALTLSDIIPNKSGYIFVKWNTKADGSGTSYSPNASYTANSLATLYAIWKVDIPTLSNVQVYRCDKNGNKDDFGTSIYIKFNWSSETGISLVTSELDTISPPHIIQDTVISESFGEISYKWDCDANSETSHTIVISVKGGNENSQTKNVTKKIPTAKYVLDFKNGGTGLAIGKVAEEDGLDVEFTTRFRQDIRSERDVIANLGETGQVSLSSLANLIKTNQAAISSLVPVTSTITIPSSNANFSGNLYVATSGKVRTILAAVITKRQITTAMGWLDVLTFQGKPIQAVQCVFPVNSAASPTPTFMTRFDTSGLLNILAQQTMAAGINLRFTLTVILA